MIPQPHRFELGPQPVGKRSASCDHDPHGRDLGADERNGP